MYPTVEVHLGDLVGNVQELELGVGKSNRRLFDGNPIATNRRGAAGLYGTTWAPKGLKRGKHALWAVVEDTSGATRTAAVGVKVCSKKK